MLPTITGSDDTTHWWREPARDLPVIGSPDVLVVGAGSAGVAAAVAAGRRGADVWLVERSGFVGGLASVGLINLLLTLDDGDGHQVVAGLCQEFVDRLDERGEARFPSHAEWNAEDPQLIDRWRRWGLIWGSPESIRYSVAFDPEAFVDISLDALAHAGVRVRLHTWFAGVARQDHTIQAVYVESKRGREVVLPKVVVDTTGDGDVMVAAGADYEQVAIPPYLWFRVGGIEDIESATNGFVFRTTSPGRVLVPWGPHHRRVDPCDPDDMTQAELECRQSARAYFADLRRQNRAMESAWLDDYARMLGITESRRLVGEYVLRKEDGGTHFDDAIARTGHWTKRRVVYEIPYRCLRSPSAINLVVAGRCISTTRYVHQATKEIPAAMATGEAAGVAAALAAKTGTAVGDVDIDALRDELRAGGADVGA